MLKYFIPWMEFTAAQGFKERQPIALIFDGESSQIKAIISKQDQNMELNLNKRKRPMTNR
jgi:hypothetical protein